MAPFSRFSFDEAEPQAVKTLFVQEMLHRGFLASTAFYAMYAHTDAQVASYGAAVREVFGMLRTAIDARRSHATATRASGPFGLLPIGLNDREQFRRVPIEDVLDASVVEIEIPTCSLQRAQRFQQDQQRLNGRV